MPPCLAPPALFFWAVALVLWRTCLAQTKALSPLLASVHTLHRCVCVLQVVELLGLMRPTNNSYRIDLLTKSFSTLKQQLLKQHGHIDTTTPPPAAANGTDSSTTAAAAAGEGSVSAVHEPWFDMDAVKWQLPESLTGSWASADVSADLALPPPNPFVPTDFTLKGTPAAAAAAADGGTAAAEQQQQQKEIEGLPQWVLCKVGGQPGAINTLLATPPEMIVDKPGAGGEGVGFYRVTQQMRSFARSHPHQQLLGC